MKGLIIREPWIDMILNGSKTWELRTQRTTLRGEIALIRKGSGQIEAVAQLVDSLHPLDPQGLADSVQFHGVPRSQQATVISNGWLFPWLIVDTRRLSSPVPYTHPNGAVTWVDLDTAVTQAISRSKHEEKTESITTGPKVSSQPLPNRPTTSLNMPILSAMANARAGGVESKISPALETELVAVADKLGVHVKALGSDNTKMRQFTIPSRISDQIIMVNRMARSSPYFQVFLSAALDQRLAAKIGAIPGLQRYLNQRTNDYKLSHSAFNAFKEPRSGGEPFGHGWLLKEQAATQQFTELIEIVRGE